MSARETAAVRDKHSIANWFFFPYGLMLDTAHTLPVAGVYWVAYLRGDHRREG